MRLLGDLALGLCDPDVVPVIQKLLQKLLLANDIGAPEGQLIAQRHLSDRFRGAGTQRSEAGQRALELPRSGDLKRFDDAVCKPEAGRPPLMRLAVWRICKGIGEDDIALWLVRSKIAFLQHAADVHVCVELVCGAKRCLLLGRQDSGLYEIAIFLYRAQRVGDAADHDVKDLAMWVHMLEVLAGPGRVVDHLRQGGGLRSEEHTSEL